MSSPIFTPSPDRPIGPVQEADGPSDAKQYVYDAFISYRHVEPDRKWAKWLHSALETYRVPKKLVNERGVPRRIGRVFRDEDELPASADLNSEIELALQRSRFLIVVCSRRTPESEWVNKEVIRFRQLGRDERILALLVDGEPQESFPRSLREIRRTITDAEGRAIEEIEEVEPLAADVRPFPARREGPRLLKRMARLRLLACVLGCRFDDLRQREQERQKRRLVYFGAFMTLLFATMGLLAGVAAHQKAEADSQRILADEARQQEAAAREQAVREKNAAERSRYYNSITIAQQEWLHGNVGALERTLDTCPVSVRRWEWGYLKRLCHLDLLTIPIDCGTTATFSPDGKQLVTTDGSHTTIWDSTTGRQLLAVGKGDRRSPILSLGFPAMYYSPDGRRFATFDNDNVVAVLDAASGKELLALRGHEAEPTGVCFSPNGKLLATAGTDATTRIWNSDNGQELLVLRGHTAACGVQFSPDGKRVVTAGTDSTATIWDAASGKELLTLGKRGTDKSGMLSAQFSPDGKRVLTVDIHNVANILGRGGSITANIWDAESGRESLSFHESFPWCFSPDGKRLVATVGGGQVKILDAANGKELLTLQGQFGPLSSVCFSPDGKALAAACHKTAKLWDATNGIELITLRGHKDSLLSLCFSPDARRLATTSTDNTAKIWNVEPWRPDEFAFPGESGVIGFSPDGKRVAVCADKSTVKVLDSATGQELRTLHGDVPQLLTLCFSPDGKTLAAAGAQGPTKVWNVDSGQAIINNPLACLDVCFSPDGQRVATITYGRNPPSRDSIDVTICDMVSARKLATIRDWGFSLGVSFGGGVVDRQLSSCLCFSPDGKRLATAAQDKTAIWDAASGHELFALHSRDGKACNAHLICFSHDGKRLATANRDKTASVWDATDGKELFALRGHAEPVNGVCFSPDGRRLATASDDKTVSIWDADDGERVLSLNEYTSAVKSVFFSADGKRLVTVSRDNTVKIWESDLGSFPDDSTISRDRDGDKEPINVDPSRLMLSELTEKPEHEGPPRDELPNAPSPLSPHVIPPIPDSLRHTSAGPGEPLPVKAHKSEQPPPFDAPRPHPKARKLVANGSKPTWSPDARQVAFNASYSDTGIRIVSIDTLKVANLIAPGKDPAWSPRNNDRIAFVRHNEANQDQEDIWLVDSTGKNPKKIAEGGWPVWAGDGKSLFFHSRKEMKILRVGVEPPSKAVPVCDMPFTFYPAITGDGTRAAYLCDKNLVVFDTGSKKRVVERQLPGWPGVLAGWSPDGKLLGYGGYGVDRGDSLWVMNVDAGKVVQVADGPFTSPAWSPDGSVLAFDHRGKEGSCIWMIETRDLESLWDASNRRPTTVSPKAIPGPLPLNIPDSPERIGGPSSNKSSQDAPF